ncbi:NAD(P)H-dependent dehydrogenase/reductase [Oryzomonas rubra]|uniref:NAD(P)H-dependent dehydrogenase/reductase n=2 Tax=Oryzomonas rubra TaxID=2509454 RepID=A0A5A9XG49_9BACT|nr:NAD(P)H-dependent dehydrogenase/reductase [Oryzomonas rubra]
MMELLRKRRSIRAFTPEPVAPETVDLLVEALLRAPSSRGKNPWEFVVVDDKELLEQLSRSKEHGSQFIKKAPLAIVVCADTTLSDVWVEDCSIAAIIVQMAALSLGLGSCWAQMRNRNHDADRSAEEYIRKLLGLPERLGVVCVIGIGHPGEVKTPVPADKLQYDKVKRNRYA